ncbi:hypothetical protein Tco_0457566 [Tanacetum coccineum]
MSTTNQQTLAESRSLDRPLILDKGSYVPWTSRFLRLLDNKKEEGELMRHSIDKDAKQLWARIKRLMQGSDISQQERHARLMNEFDKFLPVEGESLTSVYKRFSTLINVMDQNNVHPQEFPLTSVYKRFPTLINVMDQNNVHPQLYDHLSQFEPYVNAFKAKKAARNHELLALAANSHAHSSKSHVSSSYSYSPQPNYVTHPSSVIDNDDDYHGEIQGDA